MMKDMPLDNRLEREKAELKVLIESKIFSNSPNLVQFLSYVCQQYFAEAADKIKEYNIAVDALNRSKDFDHRTDPIVRVEAIRLRKLLKKYYETEGAGHPIQISIPSGHYAPVFHNVQVVPSQAVGQEKRLTGRPILVALIVLAVLAIGGAYAFHLIHTRSPRLATTPGSKIGATIPSDTLQEEVRISAGSTAEEYMDQFGNVWVGDRYFHGGNRLEFPNAAIAMTADPLIYRTAREGDFTYDIPLKPGAYELHLHFSENYFGPQGWEGGGEASRWIDVSANGKPLLSHFDIYSDAFGDRTADIKVFKDITPVDGVLHLSFAGFLSHGLVNGIEIFPGLPGKMRPIRIVARSKPIISRDQALWQPDHFFRGGRNILRTDMILETDEPEIYQSERYGHFLYSIPVAAGFYTVTLKFAEEFFSPSGIVGGGVGSRLFDVYCNGKEILKNFDIYREAGGAFRAFDKSFQHIHSNPQDKIELTFVPVENYAAICAIEVVAEEQPNPSEK